MSQPEVQDGSNVMSQPGVTRKLCAAWTGFNETHSLKWLKSYDTAWTGLNFESKHELAWKLSHSLKCLESYVTAWIDLNVGTKLEQSRMVCQSPNSSERYVTAEIGFKDMIQPESVRRLCHSLNWLNKFVTTVKWLESHSIARAWSKGMSQPEQPWKSCHRPIQLEINVIARTSSKSMSQREMIRKLYPRLK